MKPESESEITLQPQKPHVSSMLVFSVRHVYVWKLIIGKIMKDSPPFLAKVSYVDERDAMLAFQDASFFMLMRNIFC